jgi:hypothetical protein
MKSKSDKLKSFIEKFHLKALVIILLTYLAIVTILYFILRLNDVRDSDGALFSYLDVLVFNI